MRFFFAQLTNPLPNGAEEALDMMHERLYCTLAKLLESLAIFFNAPP
jgi:hypothetical protein